jgi:hypothetical protein
MEKSRRPAILANIWEPLIGQLNEKCQRACLRRDAYLDIVFWHEARMLDEEVAGRNSDDARSYITKHLSLLKRKPLSLQLSEDTIQRINDVCERKNTPRDAFLNRVIFLLLIDDSYWERIFARVEWDRTRDIVLQELPDEMYMLVRYRMLDAMETIVHGDPFWYQRACIAVMDADDDVPLLHETMIPKDILGDHAESALGFNCFVEDWQIEGHPAQKARNADKRTVFEIFGNKILTLDENRKPVWVERKERK